MTTLFSFAVEQRVVPPGVLEHRPDGAVFVHERAEAARIERFRVGVVRLEHRDAGVVCGACAIADGAFVDFAERRSLRVELFRRRQDAADDQVR